MTTPLPLPTYQHNLALFVSQLRACLHLSQEEAAAYFYLNRSRISRYENENAKDSPKIGYLAGLAQQLAAQADDAPEVRHSLLCEVNEAIRHHYSQHRFKDWADLSLKADQYRAKQQAKAETQTAREWQTRLEQRLDLPPAVELIGAADNLSRLSEVIFRTADPWVVCVEGMGGLGKTALANALVRQPTLPGRFQEVAWVSAKQQIFLPGLGLMDHATPALNTEAIIGALLEQLGQAPLTLSPLQQRDALLDCLKKAPHLIVIDNLETVEEYRALLPTLLRLTNPTKFLLTSRYSLRPQADVFSLTLDELSQAHALQFIRYEAEGRGLADIAQAPTAQLHRVYEVAGGNPLALKLIVGQMSLLPLSHILENLVQAQGPDIRALYNFLYWQAWQLLDTVTQRLFLAMPLAQNGAVAHLMGAAQLEAAEVCHALRQLNTLSLVQVRGDNLEERRYSVHRLTKTFLLDEALQWTYST